MSVEYVIITEKIIHAGLLHGSIQNGATINLNNGKALNIIKMNDNFVNVQILDCGIKSSFKNEYIKKKNKIEGVVKDECKQSILF